MIMQKLLDRSPQRPDMTRRGFLISMAATGAAFGFPLSAGAAMNPATADGRPIQAVGETFEPSMWYWIDTEGQVNVKIDDKILGKTALNLFSTNGSLVYKREVAAEELHALYSLDFSNLPSGMYILEVNSDRERYQRKIVLR